MSTCGGGGGETVVGGPGRGSPPASHRPHHAHVDDDRSPTSDQTRLPAELKHISKRRKRN